MQVSISCIPNSDFQHLTVEARQDLCCILFFACTFTSHLEFNSYAIRNISHTIGIEVRYSGNFISEYVNCMCWRKASQPCYDILFPRKSTTEFFATHQSSVCEEK